MPGTDWRALQRWLLNRYTLTDVLTDMPLPPDTDPVKVFELIERGSKELARLLQTAEIETVDVA